MNALHKPSAFPDAGVADRARELLDIHQRRIWVRTDRLFAGLLVFEWMAGVVLALSISPRTWNGSTSAIHPHVWAALLYGAIIAFPVILVWRRPGQAITRHAIAVSQVLFSALLIDLGGGRIEMHFHVFGSLAFLAFYRDWRVLITASAVVAAHHLAGVIYVPESVYGLESVNGWRWVEHAGWVIFEDIFLILSCRQSVGEMADIARRQAMLEQSHRTVEQQVEERTRELRTAQDDLVKVARSMGMAEIATSVLHNVGNVLNSVNVSVELATTKMRQFPLNDFARVVAMMNDHRADLGAFIEKDQRGSHIPAFLATLSEILSEDQRGLLAEMASLAQNVEHIKQIINVQQTHAKLGRTAVDVNLPHAIEDALQVTCGSLKQGLIEVQREFSGPEILVGDKHALLQILINLFSNAKHALLANRPTNPVITIRTLGFRNGDRDWIRIEVHDNGAGIPQENLTRIFNHGFTTKSNGHGFGLHASANSAKQMGGTLGVVSEGPGRGATFTLEFPVKSEAVAV